MRRIQLICIPYAGGTTEGFDDLKKYFPEKIQCTALDYAGHGTRRKENFYHTFDEMVEDMAEQVNQIIDSTMETVLFGYSMGSLVVYEMLAQKRVNTTVSRVVLAAHEAPNEPWDGKKYAGMEDLEFLHKMKEFGGFDRVEDCFLENRHFRRMFFEPIRMDYCLLADYTYQKREMLDTEVLFFYAETDIPEEKVVKWQKYMEKPISFVELGKNHFFIKEFPEVMVEKIMKFIEG